MNGEGRNSVHVVWQVGKLSGWHSDALLCLLLTSMRAQRVSKQQTEASLERREGRGSATASSLRPGNPGTAVSVVAAPVH
jgi:hypothetical protein